MKKYGSGQVTQVEDDKKEPISKTGQLTLQEQKELEEEGQ